MKDLKKKIDKITSKRPSRWREKAEFRIKNRKWLEYSSQIARRVLAIIEDNEELNQIKLAELLNVKPQYVSKILKGSENLTLETIAKLSEALNVELITFPSYRYNLETLGSLKQTSKPKQRNNKSTSSVKDEEK